MMKRCIALLMTLCMLWTGMAAAFAIDIDVKAEYAEAQQALKDYLDGYSKYAIDEIVVWFGTCGNYMMSFRFSQYAQCLQAVEREEFGMIPFWLASMRQDKAFIAYLEENEFRSLDDLECYIMGCQAEAEGRIDDAIRYYNLCSICDSSSRSAMLWGNQYETKYQLALEHYRANTCQDAETARDLFRELAQMPYRDSAQMAEKAEALRLSLVDISASVKGDGLSRTVTVNANADWTAVSDVPWISLSKTKGTGNATVSIRLEENPSAEHSRTGYLTFTSEGQSVRVTVSQARRDSITARLSGTGDERTIRVTANGVWKAESNASWIGLSKTSGRDDATITVTLDKYSSTTRDRTGTVTFTCGSAAYTLAIEQKKAASISGTVTVSGNTATIKVAANGSWKASTPADWIVLKKASGSGSATITAELKDNPSATSERQGTVVLTCGDKSVSVTVRQPKGKIAVTGVSLNQTTAKLAVGGKVALAVTVSPANATDRSVTWSTSNASVATVTNGVVTGKNAGTATITVKSADGAKTAKCTVTVEDPVNIRITSVTKESNGQATIRWTDDSATRTYRVYYLQKRTDSFEADRKTGILWSDSMVGNTKNKFATTSGLVPGCSYWIIISDAKDASAQSEPRVYAPGSAKKFTEYFSSLSLQLKSGMSGWKTKVSSFSAGEIESGLESRVFVADIKNKHTAQSSARGYYGVIAIKDPLGQVFATTNTPLTYPAGESQMTWDSYSFNWYFQQIRNAYGFIPTGTYTLSLYLNGQTAGAATFQVN